MNQTQKDEGSGRTATPVWRAFASENKSKKSAAGGKKKILSSPLSCTPAETKENKRAGDLPSLRSGRREVQDRRRQLHSENRTTRQEESGAAPPKEKRRQVKQTAR
jgi:hypothetical protein